MAKYLRFIWISFQELLEYRVDFFWRLAGTAIWTPMLYFFWLAILGTGFGKESYTAGSLGVYYLAISFINFSTEFKEQTVAEDINEGYLAVHLIKPYSYFIALFMNTVASKITYIGLFTAIYLFLHAANSSFSIVMVNLPYAFISLCLTAIMSFSIYCFIGVLAFWSRRVHGFRGLFFGIGGLFSGELIPTNLLPQTLANVSQYLPFPYLAYVPASLFIKYQPISEVVRLLSIQLIWTTVSIIALGIVWKKGLKVFEATGR